MNFATESATLVGLGEGPLFQLKEKGLINLRLSFLRFFPEFVMEFFRNELKNGLFQSQKAGGESHSSGADKVEIGGDVGAMRAHGEGVIATRGMERKCEIEEKYARSRDGARGRIWRGARKRGCALMISAEFQKGNSTGSDLFHVVEGRRVRDRQVRLFPESAEGPCFECFYTCRGRMRGVKLQDQRGRYVSRVTIGQAGVSIGSEGLRILRPADKPRLLNETLGIEVDRVQNHRDLALGKVSRCKGIEQLQTGKEVAR